MPASIHPAACLIAALLCMAPAPGAASAAAPTRLLLDSVVPADQAGTAVGGARIIRPELTTAELLEAMPFAVVLAMRDPAGLQARVAAGERVPWTELEEKYLPLRGDYDRVSAWVASMGFTVRPPSRVHMSVFASGSVNRVASALGVRFARVAAADGEYTSAVSAPAVPSALAPSILGIDGLQPQFRMKRIGSAALEPRDVEGEYVYVTPDDVASAYNIPASATGQGQIIAIIDEASVLNSDLTAFWNAIGSVQTTANVTTIDVDPPASGPTALQSAETALDVEWIGALAPMAQIRLYLSGSDVFDCLDAIASDMPSYPNMTVASVSYGITETSSNIQYFQMAAQYLTAMAASGLTIVASSGDSGSNPSTSTAGAGGYSASNPEAVGYPASDPNVTGVGGTNIGFITNWDFAGETVWDDIATAQSASGGGVSMAFAKPSWQTGGSVLAVQTMRCVPDISAMAMANLSNVNLGAGYLYSAAEMGAYCYVNGGDSPYGGTSLSCPIMGAVAALINQARANAGLSPVGLLNPYLYPLAGTGAFNDVSSGSNGAYTAGPGYNLCTGLGSPNVANLISALSGPAATPPASRLIDISTRAEVGTGANIVIAGIVIHGPPATTKNILVRGVGPALSGFGLSGALAQPVVGVYDNNSTLIASNAGWGNAPTAGTSKIAASYRDATVADMSAVGAFALPAGSLDSAMVLTLPVGSPYTVQVSGTGALTGIALAEVYELATGSPEALINISARCYVGTSAALAIPGFVIQGTKPVKLLVRGVGPGLSAFGLSGTLAQPVVGIFDNTSTLIVSNAGWNNPLVAGTSAVVATYRNATAADMSLVGAFGLAANSADSAVVVTLPPGAYTAEVTGFGNTTGTALVEVYEIISN
jgi:kumamolisin